MPSSMEKRKAAQWSAYTNGASWIAWDAATAMSAVVETCGALNSPWVQTGILKICTANAISLYTREQIHEMITAPPAAPPTTPRRARQPSR